MSRRPALLSLLTFLAATSAFGFIDRNGGAQGTVDRSLDTTVEWLTGQGYRVTYSRFMGQFGVKAPGGGNWGSGTHLLITVVNLDPIPRHVRFTVESFSSRYYHYAGTSLPPGREVRVALPLADPRPFGVEALPSITDSGVTQIVAYGPYDYRNVNAFWIFNREQTSTKILVRDVVVVTRSLNFNGWVDRYGQQTQVSWPDKVANDSQLLRSESLSDTFPYPADSYGAVANSGIETQGSNWRIGNDGVRYFIIAPSGKRFFSTGINEVGVTGYTQVTGRETRFAELPPLSGEFSEHYRMVDLPDGNRVLGYNFYGANLRRKYGANWLDYTLDNIVKRMRTWGYNTLGAYSDHRLVEQNELASMHRLNVSGNYNVLYLQEGVMPDVFDPAYPNAVRTSLAAGLDALPQSDMVAGVFVDNELPWGDGKSPNPYLRYELAATALNLSALQPAKRIFVSLLIRRYRSITRLNVAWNTSFTSWLALRQTTNFELPANMSPSMQRDFTEFNRHFAVRYYSLIARTLRELGFQGLYLGSRFLQNNYTPEALDACRRFADVVSINIYNSSPSGHHADLKNKAFPVLISEYSFGAADRGRLGMPYYFTLSDADRVDANRRFLDDLATWNNLVGVHWFRWEDFPPTGRYYDGENFGMGMVSITDQPYDDLIAVSRDANIRFMDRLVSAP